MVSSKYLGAMEEFNLKNIPDLDIAVLAALELFFNKKIPEFNIPYKKPLIVGSGNAAATGKILFNDKDAVFADESDFEKKLSGIKNIDGVVLISSSGEKHSSKIVKISQKKYKKPIILITNTKNSSAEKNLDNNGKVYFFPKNREPYSYNVSSYLGMIFGKTKEDPEKIYKFIEKKISKIALSKFYKYNKFYFLMPSEFKELNRFFQIKFTELFGRKIAKDIETFEQVKHANTIVESNDELFISFGNKKKLCGKNTLFIPLPKNASYASVFCIGYYIIGLIQKNHPPWFKKNLVNYTKKASKIFNEKIEPIVEKTI